MIEDPPKDVPIDLTEWAEEYQEKIFESSLRDFKELVDKYD